jgi:L-lactate dehydrogenase (cytochrome)/(S)-mandelate dehydrogenase
VKLSQAVNIEDLHQAAKRRLPRAAFDYIEGGAEDERALAHNIEAFERIRIVPRFLVDVTERSQRTPLFGRTYGSPFGIAPTGMNNLHWPGADLALARAAAEADIPFVLSTASTTKLEKVAAAIPEHFWFQLYAPRDRSAIEDLIRRAADAGAQGLMVTVDVPAPAKRERDIRNRLSLPLRLGGRQIADFLAHPHWLLQMVTNGAPRFENLEPYAGRSTSSKTLAGYITAQISSSLDWKTIEWMRGLWKGPLVIKGLMSVADAKLAAESGADGVLLSNHGARQFDYGPSTIEMLPAFRDAVGAKLTVMLDSGIRRGAHIAKAYALGADFVFVGRAALYGVAAFGAKGAEKSVAILRDELDRFLAQSGYPRIQELRHAEIVSPY